jgi:hypothetical protein
MFDQPVPEHQRRVIRALQSGPRAPARLHRRIEAMNADASRRLPLVPAPREPALRRRLGRVAVAGGVAAVLAVALVVALSLGGPSVPSAVKAAELSLRPSTEATPPASERRPALLQRSFAGVTFPAWSKEFGWRAEGARSDELEARKTGPSSTDTLTTASDTR